jgi:hypothetical protein
MSAFAEFQKGTASFATSVLLSLTKSRALAGRIFVVFFVGHLLIGRDNLLTLKSEKNYGQYARRHKYIHEYSGAVSNNL